jgi:hypothetical protein
VRGISSASSSVLLKNAFFFCFLWREMAFFFQLGCQHRDQSCSHTLDLSPLPNVMFLGACFGREIWDTECGIFFAFFISFLACLLMNIGIGSLTIGRRCELQTHTHLAVFL